ncbi:MAG: hypothetical protein ABL949_15545 [Fimbriimonadaceae bacterium]
MIRKWYTLLPGFFETNILFQQVPLDFDPSLGYAKVPGYQDRKREEMRGLRPVASSTFKVLRGTRWLDFLRSTLPYQYLVTKAFVEVLTDLSVQEWRVSPVEIVGLPESKMYRLHLTGRVHETESKGTHGYLQAGEGDLNSLILGANGDVYVSEQLHKQLKKRKVKFQSLEILDWSQRVEQVRD